MFPSTFAAATETSTAPDPFEVARRNLFPTLQHRVLAQAADALAENRLDLAESLVSKFLAKKPKDPDALNLMADIARRSQRFDEAERLLSCCLGEAPESAGFRYNYAVILRRRGKLDEAMAQLDSLLAADPANPLYRKQKAGLLRQMGRHDEAARLLRELAEHHPRSAEVWLDYAHTLVMTADGDVCAAAYRKVLELAPATTEAWSRLADLKTSRFTKAEIAAMEELLSRPGLSTTDRAELHSALGKAYADKKLPAKAFENYAKGNALRRAGVAFEPERLTAYRLNCEMLFTPEFHRARAGWGCRSKAPIFIVGMPRSGTTLVEQILASHSAIEGLGELTELDTVVADRLSREEGGRASSNFQIGGWFEFRSGLVECFPRVIERLGAADARALGEAYLAAVRRRRKTDRLHFADKALRNFGYVGLISLILPQSKIVDVRRHPLDCGWSIFRSHFPAGQPFSERLDDIGRHYANYVRLMAHFDRVLPGRVHRVFYERLVADPETELRRLFAYLELTFEDQCLRFHENRRAVGTLSSAQVREPLHAAGMGQWVPYEPWLGPLKSALGAVLDFYPEAPG
jgi:predicted Zn-dependent protease